MRLNRRDLIKWAGAGAGAAALGGGTWLLGRDAVPTADVGIVGDEPVAPDESSSAPPTSFAPPASAPSAIPAMSGPPSALGDRLLVVIELDGGNDGMSTLVPYGSGAYYDARPRAAIAAGDLITFNDQVGLHKNLAHLHGRGAAIIQGVGCAQPDESHFEMGARWFSGDPSSGSRLDTGFLGRLADSVGDPAAAAVAVSIGSASHPAMASRKASTLCLPDTNSFGYVVGATDDDPQRKAFQSAYRTFATATTENPYEARLRSTTGQSVGFASMFGIIDESGDGGYPTSQLGQGLRLAAQMLAANIGVRIVHVPMQEDFDTHDDNPGRHPDLLASLDGSIEAFLADLDRRSMSDRVLIMTTSEFGRTLRDNDSGGLDHGTASVAMLLGPVKAGLYGEYPSLTKLSANDEPIATVSFDEYYATVAESWFGVPAGDVLSGNVAPLAGIVF